MRRLQEENLSSWLQQARRKPLILRGARQVGKSTLVRTFAKDKGLDLAEINLERHPRLGPIFQTKDLTKIVPELESLLGRRLQDGKTLLFLDEIQAVPESLPALRYFFEERPSLPVIAAGSLLEFVLSDHDFSMPVGRVGYLHLGPMTFFEFLAALREDYLLELLRGYRVGQVFPEMAHQKLLERQRQYLFVGGMPECVLAFQETGSLEEARVVHRSIIQTYQDDFAKYSRAGHERGLLHRIIEVIPKLIGKKTKYVQISREDHSRTIRAALQLLIQSRLLTPAYHTDCAVPLRANQDESISKLFFVDVGLLNSLCGLDWRSLSRLNERELIHEGGLAEQFVAQHLAYWEQGEEAPHLNYWLRESRSENAEVDFVVARGNRILPIAIKSGKSGRIRSVQQLVRSKGFDLVFRFDLNPPSVQDIHHKLTGPQASGPPVRYRLASFPLYMAELARDLLAQFRF